MSQLAPLDDPDYEPKNPPQNGIVPAVVARWGAPSQMRWFSRFRTVLSSRQDWSRFHTESALHKNWCCWRCDDVESPNDYWEGDECCCRGYEVKNKENPS